MCDNALIQEAQNGNATAFAQLLEWVYDIIFRFAFKWAGNRVDAEDITQTACIKLAKVIGQFRFESAFTSWLYRLVINCANDWQRKERRHPNSDPPNVQNSHTNQHSTEYSEDGVTEASTELSQVIAQVDVMGKDYKETLLLVYAEGQSHAEAARILGVKESTVSWRLHDIRKRLATFDAQPATHHTSKKAPQHTAPNKENTHD